MTPCISSVDNSNRILIYNRQKDMKKVQPWTILLITCYLLLYTDCKQYQKLGFLQKTTKITAIASCKLFANTIFTTADGMLHHWVFINVDNQYDLAVNSTRHQLVCSKYAWNLTYSYVGVLDQFGGVSIWEEEFYDESPIKSKLTRVYFQHNRSDSVARDISVDSNLTALGYHFHNINTNTTNSTIDIYKLNQTNNQLFSLSYTTPYRKFKLDLYGNIAVIVETGGNLYFRYYNSTGYDLGHQSIQGQGISSRDQFHIDYEIGEYDSEINISFLISTDTQGGFINYTNSKILTQYQPISSINLFPIRLCNGKVCTNSSKQIIQANNRCIIPLAQPITSFTCTTNISQGKLWSMYYIASVDDKNNYYIDVYWKVENYHFWYVSAGVIGALCCCASICGCARVYIQKKRNKQHKQRQPIPQEQ